MSNTNWSGVEYWDDSDPGDIAAATLALANSLRDNLVPLFASTSAAQTAASSLIAGNSALRFVCRIQGVSALYVYTGPTSGWEWAGNTTPIEYAYGTGLGPQFTLTGTPAAWMTGTYPFTPTRSGWATVGLDFDVSRLNAGFSAAYLHPKINVGAGTVSLGQVTAMFDSTARNAGQWQAWSRVKLTAGVACTAAVDVSSYSASPGTYQWQVNNLVWHVVQQ